MFDKIRGIPRLACILTGLTALLSLPATAETFTFRVRHLHSVGSCEGQLTVGENDVRYDSSLRAHARIWTYLQLKRAENASPRRLTFITYEGGALPLGSDRKYNFELIDGAVDDTLFEFLLMRVGRRAAPVPPDIPPGGRYEIAVKHLHFFGGCEGTIRITPAFVEFVTGHSRHARLWKYIDIKELRARGAYRLRLGTYEDQILLFGKDRSFNFELKEPLEPEVLEFMIKRLGR